MKTTLVVIAVTIASITWIVLGHSTSSTSPMVEIKSSKELAVFNAWDKEQYDRYIAKSKQGGEAYAVRLNDWQPATWASIPRKDYEAMRQWENQRQ